MEIFNIGIPELIFIFIIALVVLGPENLTKTAQQLGRWISRFTKSPVWHDVLSTSREIRDLPTKIVREAGLEQSLAEIQNDTKRISGEVSTQFKQVMSDVEVSLEDSRDQLNTPASIPFRSIMPPGTGSQEVSNVSALNHSGTILNAPAPLPVNIVSTLEENTDPERVVYQPSNPPILAEKSEGKLEIILPLGPKV